MKKVSDVPKKKLYKTNEVCEMFDISRATLFRWKREVIWKEQLGLNPSTAKIDPTARACTLLWS